MATLLFANFATTTTAGSITNSATAVNLASGTGALFPSPGAGEYFVGTFVDAATGLIREIVWCTARTGDSLTIVRAQEGTTGLAWAAGSVFSILWTAGQCAAMLQSGAFQQQTANYAVDSGTANSLVISLTPAPLSLTDLIGAPVRVLVNNNNSGASTISVNGLAATAIENPNGTALSADQLIADGVAEFIYSNGVFQLISTTGPAGIYAPINSPAFTGTPTAPTPITSDNSTKIATTAYVTAKMGTFISNPSPALTGTPTAPTAATGTSTTQIATTAFAQPGRSNTTNGYVKLPGGTIIQWGTSTGFNNAYVGATVTFPLAFPTACFNVNATVKTGSATVHNQVSAQVSGISSTQCVLALTNTGSDHNYPVDVCWIAVGH